MISKSRILEFIKTKYSGYEKELVDAIESGSFDLPGTEYNRALDDVKAKLFKQLVVVCNNPKLTVSYKEGFDDCCNCFLRVDESLRKPSKISSKADEVAEALKAKFGPEKMEFTEADLAEYPSLRAIESPVEGEESGEI